MQAHLTEYLTPTFAKRRTLWTSMLLALVVSLAPFKASLATAETADDMLLKQQYSSGTYANAWRTCHRLIQKYPEKIEYHYWQANILRALGDEIDAGFEYQYVLTNSKDLALKKYAMQAISEANFLRAKNQRLARRWMPPSTATDTQTKKSAEQIIAEQSDRESYDALKQVMADENQRDLDQHPEQRFAHPEEARGFPRSRTYEPVKQFTAPLTSGSDPYLDVANIKAAKLGETASNLPSQFTATPATNFHLAKEGTNLFIRQYQSSPSQPINPANALVSDIAVAKKGNFENPLSGIENKLKSVNHNGTTSSAHNSIVTKVNGVLVRQ